MSKNWARFKPRKKEDSEKDFISFSITIPREQWAVLKQFSEVTMLPISRMVSFAIDNELDQRVPFHYPIEEPQTTFVPYAYSQEAMQVLQFLKRFNSGLSKDMLLLFRRSMGIPNKTVLLLALRELFQTGLVYESSKKPTSNKFEYHPSYKWIRVKKESEHGKEVSNS